MRRYGSSLTDVVVLSSILRRGLALFADRTALVAPDGTWTWRELDRLSDRCAGNLLARGLKPGDRFATLLPNCGALAVLYCAAFKSGLVIVPLNHLYSPGQIDHALSQTETRTIVCDVALMPTLNAAETVTALDHVFVAGRASAGGATPVDTLFDDPGTIDMPTPAPDAPVGIFFTSGSTGAAKGVTFTHRQIGLILASSAKAYGFSPDDRVLAGLSFSHAGGCNTVFCCLAEAGMAILGDVASIPVTLSLIRAHKPTAALMLPAALFKLEREGHAVKDDFASVRLVFSGGDTIPEQLELEFIEKTGLPVDEIYGMTEIGMSHFNPSSGLVKRGTVGRVAPGYTAELRDSNGNPVPDGAIGRLFVRFDGIMTGYWNRPEATAEVFSSDGWFDTGDLMRVDEEGYFTFCGRQKQLIVHDGGNIAPGEVEAVLLKHPAVRAAGVIGIADLVHGEIVRAYIEVKADAAPITAAELIAFAKTGIGRKAPESVVFLSEMPLNATGKVDRAALKARAERSHGTIVL